MDRTENEIYINYQKSKLKYDVARVFYKNLPTKQIYLKGLSILIFVIILGLNLTPYFITSSNLFLINFLFVSITTLFTIAFINIQRSYILLQTFDEKYLTKVFEQLKPILLNKYISLSKNTDDEKVKELMKEFIEMKENVVTYNDIIGAYHLCQACFASDHLKLAKQKQLEWLSK